MAISNLETIIESIELMIENVRADNHGRIMLPKDKMRQLLGELKTSVPIEIKRYNEKTKELEQNKQKELDQARLNAERIMTEANDMKNKLLNENEQVRMAEARAKQIVDEANMKANQLLADGQMRANELREMALKEYDDSLAYIISLVQSMGNDVANIMNSQLQTLSNKLNEVMNIRNDLQNRMNSWQQSLNSNS